MSSTRIAELLSRRTLLTAGAAGALCAATGAAAGAASAATSTVGTAGEAAQARAATRPAGSGSATDRRPLDFDLPLDNLYAFGKMFGTYGATAVHPAFRGVCFASVGDAALRPLFGYEGFSTLRMDRLPNGHLRWWGKEIAFYTDLETGEPLETWTNPYTGDRGEVMHFLNDRQVIELTDRMPTISFPDDPNTPAGSPQAKKAPGKAPPGAFLLPWFRQGDMVQMTLEHMLRYKNPLDPATWRKESTGPYINPAEHYLFFGSVAELEDRALPSAKFTGGFMRVAPWFPWMLMGPVPGVLTIRAHMWKASDGPENISPQIRAHVAKRYPAFFEPPTEWTKARNPSTWELFKATRKPAA